MDNPVCLWQTELFKLNLKSSPSSSGYNRRRRLAPRSSRKQQAERTSVRAAPIVCPEESPLLATIGDNFAVSKSPLVGIDAPTLARGQGLQPYGALTLFFRWRKKSVQKKASGTATPEAARPAARRGLRPAVAPSGLSSSTGCPVSHSSLPVALLASHPPCGSLWAAPKAPLGPRFPSGQFALLTRREKALYCPFLKEGVRNVARSTFGLPTFTFVRARAHSFPLSKRARLFPSAAYRRSAPPQSAAGKRPLAGWDASLWPEDFAAWINGLIFFSPQLAWGRLNPCGLGCFLVAWVFLPRKRPAGFQIHAGLFREP